MAPPGPHLLAELQIVHRHADPLVREIPFSHLAELARGLPPDDQSR